MRDEDVDKFFRDASVDELEMWLGAGGELPGKIAERYRREKDIQNAVRAGLHPRTVERIESDRERLKRRRQEQAA